MTDASVLCHRCYNIALSKAPVIIKVPEDHENYKSGTLTVFYWQTYNGSLSDNS